MLLAMFEHMFCLPKINKNAEGGVLSRQTTNGSYWHCLLLQGKNQSNFGAKLSEDYPIHDQESGLRV